MIVDQEDWFNFIRSFFKVGGTTDWLRHVISNWNWIINEPGCRCRAVPSYKFCDEFLGIQSSTIKDEQIED